MTTFKIDTLLFKQGNNFSKMFYNCFGEDKIKNIWPTLDYSVIQYFCLECLSDIFKGNSSIQLALPIS